jgi:hypothetical protein
MFNMTRLGRSPALQREHQRCVRLCRLCAGLMLQTIVLKFYSCNVSDGNSQLKGEVYVLCKF